MRLLLVMTLLGLTACVVLQPISPVIVQTGVDFRSLTADGFFMSTSQYPGAHDALGLVMIRVVSGAKVARQKPTDYDQTLVLEEISLDSALALAKTRARAMNADGLMNLEIETAGRRVGNTTYGLDLPGWSIRGLAFKRQSRTDSH